MTPTASSRSPSSRATAQVLAAKLARYDEVYGIAGRGARPQRPRARRLAPRPDPADRSRARAALARHRADRPPRRAAARGLAVERSAPLVVAQPVINGGDVTGAVVTLSPTDRLRRSVARSWLIVVLGELIALIGCALLASRLTRWILRPVARPRPHRPRDRHRPDGGARARRRRPAGAAPPDRAPSTRWRRSSSGSSSASATSSPTPRTSCATRCSALLLRLDSLAIGAPRQRGRGGGRGERRPPPRGHPRAPAGARQGRRRRRAARSASTSRRSPTSGSTPGRPRRTPRG